MPSRQQASDCSAALAGRDEWLRFAPVWHGAMGNLGAMTAVLASVDGGLSTVAVMWC